MFFLFRSGFWIPRNDFSDQFFQFSFNLVWSCKEYKPTILIYLHKFVVINAWVIVWFKDLVCGQKEGKKGRVAQEVVAEEWEESEKRVGPVIIAPVSSFAGRRRT